MIYFYLMNKPGMIIMGTEDTYDCECDGGYAPQKIIWDTVRALVAEGWDIWVDVGGRYIRLKNPNPCDL